MDTKGIEYCEAATKISANVVQCVPVAPATSWTADKFHFGGSDTTNDYQVDMRAEAVVLDRTIAIVAELDYMNDAGYNGPDTEAWGCRVLVAQWYDSGHEINGVA